MPIGGLINSGLTKRDGARPFNARLHRRESLGQLAPGDLPDDYGFKNADEVTSKLPNYRSEANIDLNNSGNPKNNVTNLTNEPISIPIKMYKNDGSEPKIINPNESLEEMRKKMDEQMNAMRAKMGIPTTPFGKSTGAFGDNFFDVGHFDSNLPGNFRKVNHPTLSKSTRPATSAAEKSPPVAAAASSSTKPTAANSSRKMSVDMSPKTDRKMGPAPATMPRPVKMEIPINRVSPPSKKNTCPTTNLSSPPVKVTRNINNSNLTERDVDPSEVDTYNLGASIKDSPKLERRQKSPYNLSRRSSCKIEPEISDPSVLLKPKVKSRTNSVDPIPNQPSSKISQQFTPFLNQILDQAYEISKFNPNFEQADNQSLKADQNAMLVAGEMLYRIVERIDCIDSPDDRISKKVITQMANFWMDKADKIKEDIVQYLKADKKKENSENNEESVDENLEQEDKEPQIESETNNGESVEIEVCNDDDEMSI